MEGWGAGYEIEGQEEVHMLIHLTYWSNYISVQTIAEVYKYYIHERLFATIFPQVLTSINCLITITFRMKGGQGRARIWSNSFYHDPSCWNWGNVSIPVISHSENVCYDTTCVAVVSNTINPSILLLLLLLFCQSFSFPKKS